jgi:hypothetical protein
MLAHGSRRRHRSWRWVLIGGCGAGWAVVALSSPAVPPIAPVVPVAPPEPVQAEPAAAGKRCTIDMRLLGTMADVISNVLLRQEGKPGGEVRAFLEDAKKTSATADELLKASAVRFGIDEQSLSRSVELWKHVNCRHEPVAGYQVPDNYVKEGEAVPASVFAANVTLHVVLHELGHAVVREFDVAVLGNEETMADAFATHFLVEHMPDRALEALKARVSSLMVEAGEVPVEKWTVRGEHDNDARRAYQIAALAVAADSKKYAEVGAIVGMSEREIGNAKDYGSDIHRAWRRTLAPIMMPAGRNSREARFRADPATEDFVKAGEHTLESSISTALQSIDWHSQVTVEFVGTGGGAAWNRSKRTVTVGGDYLRRFVGQGVRTEKK